MTGIPIFDAVIDFSQYYQSDIKYRDCHVYGFSPDGGKRIFSPPYRR
jgi:hypothetical protein